MATFDDYKVAAKMRDLIRAIVAEEVQKLRPLPIYGTVSSIDRTNRKCGVVFPGDSEQAIVSMGTIQPSTVGQVVRVGGTVGDRYIEDVMSPAYFAADGGSYGPPGGLYGAGSYG